MTGFLNVERRGRIAILTMAKPDSMNAIGTHQDCEDIVSALPGGRYGVWSGTSMAAPIASGIAALVKARNPGWVPHAIVEQLSETGVEWDCTHPTRGEIKTSRVDALFALTDNTNATNPFACTQ